MAVSKFNDFCTQVCEHVAELAAHMEDHAAALMERGVPEEAAAQQAVAAMGDPEEIGKELDKSHSPLLGWFQIWFRRAVWCLAVLVLLFTLPQAGTIAADLTAPLQDGGHLDEFLTHDEERSMTSWQTSPPALSGTMRAIPFPYREPWWYAPPTALCPCTMQ